MLEETFVTRGVVANRILRHDGFRYARPAPVGPLPPRDIARIMLRRHSPCRACRHYCTGALDRPMKQNEHQEILASLQMLTDTADRFVQHVPPLPRMEQIHRRMLAAITKARLVLSLHRPLDRSPRSSHGTASSWKLSRSRKSSPPVLRLV